jgi:hypothetical protein
VVRVLCQARYYAPVVGPARYDGGQEQQRLLEAVAVPGSVRRVLPNIGWSQQRQQQKVQVPKYWLRLPAPETSQHERQPSSRPPGLVESLTPSQTRPQGLAESLMLSQARSPELPESSMQRRTCRS